VGGGETGPSGRCIPPILGGEKLAEWKEWTLDGAGEPAGLILAEGFILFFLLPSVTEPNAYNFFFHAQTVRDKSNSF